MNSWFNVVNILKALKRAGFFYIVVHVTINLYMNFIQRYEYLLVLKRTELENNIDFNLEKKILLNLNKPHTVTRKILAL